MLSMPGLFNVDNALATIAICELLGIPEEDIVGPLARQAGCPGAWSFLHAGPEGDSAC